MGVVDLTPVKTSWRREGRKRDHHAGDLVRVHDSSYQDFMDGSFMDGSDSGHSSY
jgi:hypothetical protein